MKPMHLITLVVCWLGLSVHGAETLVIRGAAVFDAASGSLRPQRTIVIEGERIRAIGSPEDPVTVPSGARIIEAAGKYVLPGLIDAHVHLVHLADRTRVTGDEFLPLFLAAGVTSVRSAGDAIVAEAGVAHYAESHPELCPRVFLASPLIDGSPPVHRDIGFSLTEASQIVPFVDDMAAWNVVTLKLYVGTPRSIGREIIRQGHLRGMKVAGHLGRYTAQEAVEDGIDVLEHIWSVFNYSIPPEVKGQPGHRARLDLSNPQCQALVAAIAKQGVAVDPTLVVFRNMIYLNDLEEVHAHPDLAHVPKRMRRFWDAYRAEKSLTIATRELRRQEVRKYQELTGILHRAGVKLLVGTDTPEPYVPPGFSLHQELEMLVEAGLSPAGALQAATLHNAGVINQTEHLGSVEVDKLADLVILDADPTVDIRNTRRIAYVVRGGRVCDPRALLNAVPRD
jgi:hypothetical protein